MNENDSVFDGKSQSAYFCHTYVILNEVYFFKVAKLYDFIDGKENSVRSQVCVETLSVAWFRISICKYCLFPQIATTVMTHRGQVEPREVSICCFPYVFDRAKFDVMP